MTDNEKKKIALYAALSVAKQTLIIKQIISPLGKVLANFGSGHKNRSGGPTLALLETTLSKIHPRSFYVKIVL